MAFSLTNKWVWDFWFAQDKDRLHLFFLQADRSLAHPEWRHFYPSIGHATTRDLENWDYLGTVLAPATKPAWDDYTTWTGSIVHFDDRWWMFYSGTSRREQGLKQRIFLAHSQALHHWTKLEGGPVLDFDPRWYEEFCAGDGDLVPTWHDRAWRDPWVMQFPGDDRWHMVFTARTNKGERDGRGCIGHAISDDFITWQAQEPLWAEGLFGQMEVPQIIEVNGYWYCLFSTQVEHWSSKLKELSPDLEPTTGTHYLRADAPTGPWTLENMPFFIGDREGSVYGGKLLVWKERLCFFGFRNYDQDGQFYGDILGPLPVSQDMHGRLELVVS